MSYLSSIYSRFFATIYDPILYRIEQRFLHERRRRLLKHAKGRVLEIGAGTGANFRFYPPTAKVTAVEPSLPMFERAKKATPPHAVIELLPYGMGDVRLDEQIPADSLDAIVCTLVLCTVPDLSGALTRCFKWLKPGGKLLVFEHIKAKHGKTAVVQEMVTPIWKHLAEGCHLNRATDEILLKHGFSVLEERRIKKGLDWYEAILEKPSNSL